MGKQIFFQLRAVEMRNLLGNGLSVGGVKRQRMQRSSQLNRKVLQVFIANQILTTASINQPSLNHSKMSFA